MQLRCTNCDAAFEGEPSARCPKCLRVTSVVVASEEAAADGTVRAASWPAGRACPLCLERDVSERPEAIFYFEAARELAEGTRRIAVRCRCCDDCRARVVSLAAQRKIAAPFVAAGVVAAALSLFADGPFVRLGISYPTSIVVGFVIAFVVAGIPLYVIDRGGRDLRRRYESSWLFGRVKSLASDDRWRVRPEVSEETKEETLRAEDLASK